MTPKEEERIANTVQKYFPRKQVRAVWISLVVVGLVLIIASLIYFIYKWAAQSIITTAPIYIAAIGMVMVIAGVLVRGHYESELYCFTENYVRAPELHNACLHTEFGRKVAADLAMQAAIESGQMREPDLPIYIQGKN